MPAWSQVLDTYDVLDDAAASGASVQDLLRRHHVEDVQTTTVSGNKGTTDCVFIRIPGTAGRASGGDAPTLGIIGRLGGVGARPAQLGFVSDGDGALVALSVACKLGDMRARGDVMRGDVIIATHVCPDAPVTPHEPRPFMDSPIDIAEMNRREVSPDMDAVLSVDATKANRVCNYNGFAISPTVREGWILRVSEHLLDIMQTTTGRPPVVLPITTQDITPYGNGVFHLNSIMQPATATSAPVVGVAVTSEAPIGGNATGGTDLVRIESVVRFCVEVANEYGEGRCQISDDEEYGRLTSMYGSLRHLGELTPASGSAH